MGVVNGVVGEARKRAAALLGTYGRVVVGVADALAGGPDPDLPPRPVTPPARPRPVAAAEPEPVAATAADLRTLRAAALDSTLAATSDPSRSAAERFTTRVPGVSDWTAGRLLGDTQRLLTMALDIAASTPDGPGARRTFTATLRRQFPWLDEDTAARLWDHARFTGSTADDQRSPDDPGGPRRLLDRLRRRA